MNSIQYKLEEFMCKSCNSAEGLLPCAHYPCKPDTLLCVECHPSHVVSADCTECGLNVCNSQHVTRSTCLTCWKQNEHQSMQYQPIAPELRHTIQCQFTESTQPLENSDVFQPCKRQRLEDLNLWVDDDSSDYDS